MSDDDSQGQDAKVQQIHAVIETLEANGPILGSRQPNAEDLVRVSIPSDEGKALRRWVNEEGAAQTIEIGLAFGYSALHICEGLLLNARTDMNHVVMDPNQVNPTVYDSRGLDILKEAGLSDLIEFYDESSQIVLAKMVEEGRQFDLAFVDGNHRFDGVFLDLYYLGQLVRKGGLIILDDYNYPGIKKAASFFIKNLEWTVDDVSATGTHEWAVLRTSTNEDDRHHRFFVDF